MDRRLERLACALAALSISLPGTSAPAAGAASRPLRLADWFAVRRLADPQCSPDGAWVAYTVARVDSARDRYDSDVWMTRWDGSASVRLTTSDESESSPRWSPDGRTLAFLSKRQGSKAAQVWLLPTAGGESERVTDVKGGVSGVEWSPDGKRLALLIEDAPPAADSAAEHPRPVVVDRIVFKQDEQGYVDSLRTHLWVLDLASRQ